MGVRGFALGGWADGCRSHCRFVQRPPLVRNRTDSTITECADLWCTAAVAGASTLTSAAHTGRSGEWSGQILANGMGHLEHTVALFVSKHAACWLGSVMRHNHIAWSLSYSIDRRTNHYLSAAASRHHHSTAETWSLSILLLFTPYWCSLGCVHKEKLTP